MKKSPRGISTVQESSFCRASDGASSSTSERPLALKIALDDLIWDDSDGVDDVAKDFLEKGRADCRRQKPCLILHSPERTLRAPQPSTRNVSFVPFLTVFRYPLIRVSLGGSQRSTSRLHDVFSRELNVSVSFEERQEKEDLREGWNVTLISSVPGSLFGPCHKQWLRVQNLQNICIAADVDNIPINSKLTSPISLVSVGLGLPPLTASFSCPANTANPIMRPHDQVGSSYSHKTSQTP
ncbi:hypothetical protein D9619_002519 [Psilocybe cf. subviscida]|uniref:Uncharacterized protein n=1 Tax=Psilocybe cf. subviscida TaxID=2480587 RepID=A0A8H5AXE2_9AGAR|nr:hypothetical protein D9619_002519 [Psilocybe cf. subviscida]